MESDIARVSHQITGANHSPTLDKTMRQPVTPDRIPSAAATQSAARQNTLSMRIPAQIAADLGAKIVSGQVSAGTILEGEVEASGQRQVSRSAYREAVRILGAKGLVESRAKTGTTVSAMEHWHLLDPDVLAWLCKCDPSPDLLISLFELRIMVEPEAAAFAAQRRTQMQLYEMADALTEMERKTLQTAAGRAADGKFHSILLASSRNPFLASLASSVAAAVDLSTFFKQRTERLRRDAVPDHWRVYRAIATGDPKAARKAMKHLVRAAFEDTTAAALKGTAVQLSAP